MHYATLASGGLTSNNDMNYTVHPHKEKMVHFLSLTISYSYSCGRNLQLASNSTSTGYAPIRLWMLVDLLP